MLRISFFALLLFLALTALSPYLSHAAGDGKQDSGDIGKLLDERLSNETADGAKQEQLALAKAKRQGVLTEGDAVLKDIDTLQATIQRWENQMNALLTNAEGQALATDPVNVQHFIGLQHAERYQLDQVDGARGEIQTLLMPLQTASDNSLFVPGDTLVMEIRNKSKKVKDALKRYQELQTTLRALLQTSKGVQVNSDNPNLESSIQKLGEERAKQDLETQQIARNKAENEQKKRLAEVEAEIVRVKAEGEIQRLKDEKKRLEEETERKRREAEQRAEEAKRQHEHQQHLAKAKSLVSKYAPFLAKGDHTLSAGHHSPKGPLLNGSWPKTDEPEPVSLTALNVWNALGDAKMFVKVATAPYNDRPKAGWQNLSDEEAQKRLDEFNTYSDAWQELGLLNK